MITAIRQDVSSNASILTVLENTVRCLICAVIWITVCMFFSPKDKSKVVCDNFPCLSIDSKLLQFFFTILLNLSIYRPYLYVYFVWRYECTACTLEQILLCIGLVSAPRKSKLGYLDHTVYVCMVLYCSAWKKCVVVIIDVWSRFGYNRLYSVTGTLLDLQLPSFDIVLYNYKFSFNMQLSRGGNAVVNYHCSIGM